MSSKSVFELILSGEIESEIIYEDDDIFAINDINPVARVHILVIPKKKIETINDLKDTDVNLAGKMIMVAKQLAYETGIDGTGYRLLFNTNDDAMQTVFHIHLHLIGGEKVKKYLMNIEKIIPLDYELIDIFGVNDKNLKFLKTNFKKAKINVKGNVVYISGDEKTTSEILKIFDEMLLIANRGDIIEIEDLKLISSIKNEQKSVSSKTSNVLIHNNKNIKVKNLNQLKYLETIENSTITFGIGPAGTGKTFLAVASAVKMYSNDQIKKIVLTRPAVEAGERLGYLPGDLSQKIDPYLVPLFDSLEYFFGNETLQYLIDKRNIEIVPLAYMRGRTLNDACIILDEAQNAKVSQIKMFLTRLGENSKMIITGDESQIDLINKDFSGLKKTRKSISNIDEISVVEFQNTDIVRNKIVSKILEVFPDK